VVVDWVGAHRCEARCRSELAVDGWAAAPVWGAGEPRRGTSEDAQRALMDAFTARDFDQLGVITGGLMFEPGFEATYTADPGAFWKSIEVAIETGQWAERSEWSEVGGVWVLGFR